MNRRFHRNDFANPNSLRLYSNAAGALLLAGAAVVTTAIGCGWSFVNDHSVRFSGYSSPGDFTRLPPLPIKPDARREASPSPGTNDEDEQANYEAEERRQKAMDEVWEQASEAETRGDFARTGRLLREYLNRSSAVGNDGPYDAEEVQIRRNSAFDRLDALTALGQGVKPSLVATYLAARHRFDLATELINADQLRTLLEDATGRLALADNVAYLRAAILYREKLTEEAAKAFHELAAKYPHSEKREAALYMNAVALLRFHCPPGHDGAQNDVDCEDREEAREAFRRVLREYPHGRYAPDARGWIAHLLLRSGDRAAALADYYRALSETGAAITKQSLLVSLRLTRGHASDAEIQEVEADLADEPVAALTYAYHTIYNYASRAGYYDKSYRDPWEAKQEWEREYLEKQETTLLREASRRELARISAFGATLLRRYPNSVVSGGFALRLAQAQLELGEPESALQSAARALRTGVRDRERAEALWVKGSSEWRLRNYATARRTLKQLTFEFPQSDLAEGAGRLVAMAAEDAGDLDGALEQYIALNYEDDFAYFVDVLMTPEQLAGFIARHPDSPRLNDLNYALAVRYLRAKRWTEARAALALVKVTEQRRAEQYYSWEESADPVEFRSNRTAKVPSDVTGIAARWLWRDLKTAEDLERLERQAAEAQGDEAKAEALYQIASYLYQSSTLLFYNPGLWSGARHYKLEEVESNNSYRAPGEAQLLWRHALEHEPVAHALELYLEVARRFPNTRAARDALYTAAICHERLSDYNTYWRNIYGIGLHAGPRMVTFKDVRRAYPDYRLPRATIGWEPVTRTVYGGPGWVERPKPKPRPDWRSRAKQRLGDLLVELQQKQRDTESQLRDFKERLVSGLIYSVLAVSLLAACYFAAIVIYLKNQKPMFAPIFEEGRIAARDSDCPTSSTISRVEKIINDR
ncbi:MAG TPA: outer membrane protein assembly factor BamD [Blastocatellia bacterium]|nr:outer membrane protein assembly factor BamD [Blastocatellia bacterium]